MSGSEAFALTYGMQLSVRAFLESALSVIEACACRAAPTLQYLIMSGGNSLQKGFDGMSPIDLVPTPPVNTSGIHLGCCEAAPTHLCTALSSSYVTYPAARDLFLWALYPDTDLVPETA